MTLRPGPRPRASLAALGPLAPLALAALAPGATPHAAAAQDTPPVVRRAEPERPLCWRGRPLPRCRAFALFELAVHEPLATTRVDVPFGIPTVPGAERRPAFERTLSWSAGVMRNVDARHAVGAALVGAAAGTGAHGAVTLRARRWLASNASVEGAVGPGVAEVYVPTTRPRFGPTVEERWRPAVVGEVRLNGADLVALSARGVLVPRAGGRAHGAAFVGASTGSWTAVVGTLAVGAFAAFLYVALGSAAT